MPKVRVAGFSVSLDGFSAGIEQSLSDPLGKRGREIFQWFFHTKSFCSMHGQEEGTTGDVDDSIFDGKTLTGWDADPRIWRVEHGVLVGETFEGKPKGNNYIVYRGTQTRDFDLKLKMKIEKGGGGGIQYRSVTGLPWTRPPPAGQPPYDLRFMMTGPQADFWFPVNARAASYTGQWYSENTMQGILAYRGQVTQALPGQTNRLVARIGDQQALGGYVRVNEWNDYEIIARGGVMMHIMNGQLMAVFLDDNKASVNNQPGLIGFEIESQPCKISVRDIWLRRFD